MRTALLNIKQRGAYHGYVAKFQEQLRLVPLEPTFAKEIFLKGLTSAKLRKQILRKNPQTLEEVIAEGFAEDALEGESKSSQAFTPKKSSNGDARDNKEIRQNLQNKPRPQKSKCINCHRGFHKSEDCWVKFPEKRPTQPSDRKTRSPNQPRRDKTDNKAKYYALIDKLVVDENDSTPASLNE
ncbi:hypothetical protein L914_05722 [Phytophthora nicotianae]|uniref:Uncharacterized protein n=2 Tax=Phytophthora nicotianae TaxID=4792 RepID=V9FIH8_PHYNI|nr:hypothetical protein F443_05893 [Phytophthora nicotianae P1569]ETM50197.1 hypothetical protein L914_05722 [Phytophthora nicotianae]